MKKLISLTLITWILSAADVVWGGGWVSAGGESLIYARNPWFVKNTKTVNYCIEMDEISFSISRSEVENLIVRAFDYWTREFSNNSTRSDNSPGFAKLATQEFRYIQRCDRNTFLIFKFGLKTLNRKEVKFLGDPKKFIGVTVRKSYSFDLMQGRGIIYISADKGEDAYTNNGHMISEAWKSPILMQYALIHELGHLFGISHLGSGLMSEVFMTILLNKDMAKEFDSAPLQRFLNPQDQFIIYNKSGHFNPDFFGIPRNTAHLKLEALPGRDYKWNIYQKDETTGDFILIGVTEATSLDQTNYSLKPAATVQLPPEQRVFSPFETIMGPFLVGGFFSDTSYKGVFRPKDSIRAIPIHMSLSAEKISFIGTVNNLQKIVLQYNQPSFMRAIFP